MVRTAESAHQPKKTGMRNQPKRATQKGTGFASKNAVPRLVESRNPFVATGYNYM